MSIIPFKSRQEFTCEQNLASFISRAKHELTIYDSDGGFSSDTWYHILKGGKRSSIAFKEFESSRGKSDGAVFKQPFLDFARAYVREQQSIKRVAPGPMMAALKAVYFGLMSVHNDPSILRLDNLVIRKAKEAVESRTQAAARYAIGGHMKKLLDWLKENHICLQHTVWRQSPWKRQRERASGTSAADRNWQEERLPTATEMAALADAFAMAKTPYQLYWSSCAVLLMFAPNRAGELPYLGIDCLFETTGYEEKINPLSGELEKLEVTVLNIRWKAEKGGGGIPKPVHPKLELTVREAVSRLTELGKPARDAARWATLYPDRFFRHEGCITAASHGEDDALNYEELCAAMNLQSAAKTADARGKTDPGELAKMVPFRSKWFQKLSFGKDKITYRDLAEYTAKNYAAYFPKWPYLEEVKFLVCDSLCLVRDNEFHEVSEPKSFTFIGPSVDLCNGALGSAKSRSERQASMFDMLNIKDEYGDPIKITSHQVRAWLCTMAERGEMDSLDLAMFAGRTRIEDNRAYDLRSQEERRAAARSVMNPAIENGLRIIKSVEINVPVTFKDLGYKDRAGVGQWSGFGFCEHDWTMSPCSKAGDCAPCSEHACIKGLPKSLERLKELEVAQATEFDRASQAHEAGEYGAEAWMVFLGKRLAVTRTLIRMHEDKNIPVGTIIRVPETLDPTATQVALTEKGLKADVVPDDNVSRNIVESAKSEFLSLMGRLN